MKKDKLLNRVHKNSQTGLFTLPKINEMSENPDFKQILQSHEEEYKNVYYGAERLSSNNNLINLSALAKVRTRAMLNLNTLTDKSSSHLAEMLIMGSTAGVVDITKSLRQYPNAPKASKDLAQNLLNIEEKNIEVLKQFL
ncbi:MAG: hypothetical protein A2Y15_03060 [Clostridiales bacterium GWF2_36_10]|nr:MAG: hypothetical protein A2Y15_03060 [Clostridiales bacterium GWF2_36_10]HAN20953.1 hypothetical protein [Clostridiales bacterium]